MARFDGRFDMCGSHSCRRHWDTLHQNEVSLNRVRDPFTNINNFKL